MSHLQYYSESDDDSIGGVITAPTIIKKRVTDPNRNQKSKYKGVFRCGKKFKAQIQTNGIQHYLGLYDTEDEAALAYDRHSREVLGPKAKTNFDTSVESLAEDNGRNGMDIEPEPTKPRGSHPRRTYIGIKQKRKRGGSGPLDVASVSLQQSIREPVMSVTAPVRSRDAEWRKQSFFWFGALSYDPVGFVLSWKGSLLGYTKARPTADQLQWSRNYFDYAGPSSVQPELVIAGTSLKPLSGPYKGSYMLDDGEGRQEKYSDQFELDFREIPGSLPLQYTVVGVGVSDVGGNFVLDGAYDSGSRALALSRNYVRATDALGVMSLEDLKQYHGRQLTAVEVHPDMAPHPHPAPVAPVVHSQPPPVPPMLEQPQPAVSAIGNAAEEAHV